MPYYFRKIIHNYTTMLQDDHETKELMLHAFQKTILHFWEEEVKHVVVSGKPKELQVYLVDQQLKKELCGFNVSSQTAKVGKAPDTLLLKYLR